MRLNSKGQVTIPAHLREQYGLHEGDEVDVIEDGNTLRIVRVEASTTRGQRLVRRMRGRATTSLRTDKLLDNLRFPGRVPADGVVPLKRCREAGGRATPVRYQWNVSRPECRRASLLWVR